MGNKPFSESMLTQSRGSLVLDDGLVPNRQATFWTSVDHTILTKVHS